jgi:chitinase
MNRIILGLVLIALTQINLLTSQDWDQEPNDRKYKVVCYYTNWAQYRPQPGTYFPENVDPNLCTHIIFAFAKINAQYELEAFEWNDGWEEWAPGMYNRTVELKKKNPRLKVLLAVGGMYSYMVISI